MSDLDKQNARAWSNYWSAGFESTFTGHDDTEFFKVLDQQWLELFAARAENSTIVDLGAGNGALTAKISEANTQAQKGFTVIAVDYSDIESRSPIFKNEDITVRSHTAIEETGLEDQSVDLAVSQYGFEYADHEKASAEIARILKPGGEFNAVVHHRQSEVSQSCASTHMQVGLCYRSELTSVCAKLIKRLRKLDKSHRDPREDETSEKLRDELNTRVSRVLEYAQEYPDQNHVNYYVNELTSLFGEQAKKLNFGQKLAIIENVEEQEKHLQLRMEAMLKASLDAEGIKALEDQLRKNGLLVEESEILTHDFKTFGWRLIAKKPN